MQTKTDQTAIVPNAHDQRLRAIVKRLVIDLGYLQWFEVEHPEDLKVRFATAALDAAIDDLAEKITPTE
jgi:hypothetical protein